MSKYNVEFEFPTDEKQAVELLRLQADVSDLADGTDDVDETNRITRAWVKELWRKAQTPSVTELALRASGHDDLTHYADRSPESDDTIAVEEPGMRVGWDDLVAALKASEKEGPLRAASITSALAGLGLERDTEPEQNAGCMVFKHNTVLVGIRVYQLGTIRVAEIATSKRKKKQRGEAFETVSSGTYVAGTLINARYWREMVDAFISTLKVSRTALKRASKGGQEPPIPVEFAAFKAFIGTGKDKEDRREDKAELAEIGTWQKKIRSVWLEMLDKGNAPTGVMLSFDGPDGAGKTSSSKYIPAALLAANRELPEKLRWSCSTQIFKAPTDEDKAWMAAEVGAVHGLPKWLARHTKRGIPRQQEILIKDRFTPGDYVYVGEHTPERLEQMADENQRYEAWVASQGVLTFKAILWADRDKQAKTFGKRMARGAFVDALIAELRRRGELTDEKEDELRAVKHKVEGTDLIGLSVFKEVLPRFKDFGRATKCPVIEATDRHAARLELLERFVEVLSAYAKKQA